ncbi:MAG: hypothetical protein JKX73_05065, partial [Flavobacteriales bacterium]|nr:hypothetical protein [Flavobacteriales bacterium]
MIRNLLIIVISALALSMSSCTQFAVRTLGKRIDLKVMAKNDSVYHDNTFAGIAKQLGTDEKANIIMVHGVRKKRIDHFDATKDELMSQLGFTKKADYYEEITYTPLAEIVQPNSSSWKILKTKYYRGVADTIIIYDVYWSPVTSPIKNRLMRFDTSRYRTVVAANFKKHMLIDVFGDLTLYQSKVIRDELAEPFVALLGPIESHKTFLIGGGFGSTIFSESIAMIIRSKEQVIKEVTAIQRDSKSGSKANMMTALSRMLADYQLRPADLCDDVEVKNSVLIRTAVAVVKHIGKQETYEACKGALRECIKIINAQISRDSSVLGKIEGVYLISNQLPFASLFYTKKDQLNSFYQMDTNIYRSFRPLYKKGDPLTIVSFYDRNDPFGYHLPKSLDTNLTIVNVQAQNAPVFAFDPRKAIRELVPMVKNQNSSGFIFDLLDQDKNVQELLFSIDQPQEMARSNAGIIKSIVKGISDTTRHRNGIPMPSTEEVVGRKFRQGLGGRMAANFTAKRLARMVRRFEVKPAVLPFKALSLEVDSFTGIQKSVDTNDLTQVITVHGMRHKTPNHFDEMIMGLVKNLNFYETPTLDTVHTCFPLDCDPKPRTRLLRDSTSEEIDYLAGATSVRVLEFENSNDKKLRFYVVYWSPLTYQGKEWLKKTSRLEEKSALTRLLNKDLISYGLGDVALVLNGFEDPLHATFSEAFKLAERDNKLPAKENAFIITGSLGSKLLYDYVSELHHSTRVDSVMKRLDKWFMLTNQLSITSFKDIELGVHGPDLYKHYMNNWDDDPNRDSLHIVAFNDPNDILSFRVPDSSNGITNPHVTNAYLNLANGFSVNMRQLLRFTHKIDKGLMKNAVDGAELGLKDEKARQKYRCETEHHKNVKKHEKRLFYDNQKYNELSADIDCLKGKTSTRTRAISKLVNKQTKRKTKISKHKLKRENDYRNRAPHENYCKFIRVEVRQAFIYEHYRDCSTRTKSDFCVRLFRKKICSRS